MPLTDTIYRGRFAPTPTGPLHLGSLVTALASFLDAKHNNGTWLVRIEDTDPLREMPNASGMILDTLEKHHLFWDETVLFQSERSDYYEQILARLHRANVIYPCACSRKELTISGGIHLQNCKDQSAYPNEQTVPNHATRFKQVSREYSWLDQVCGNCKQSTQDTFDDFVVKRKEGFYAYQLAVVADDISQDITHIVRGQDLLDNTPMQLAIYRALDTPTPRYSHTPLVVSSTGQKLSKQNHAPAINNITANQNLYQCLLHLNQAPPEWLKKASLKAILDWAIDNWDLSKLSLVKQIISD